MAPTAHINTFNSVMKLIGLKERKGLFASCWDPAVTKKTSWRFCGKVWGEGGR